MVQFEDPEHPAAPHFASISFDLIGLTASQAEAALAALRELPPPHRSGLYPRLIALAPPAFLPRLLESPGLGLDERHEICSWLAEIARAWSILHVATRSEDEDTALAAAAVLAHFDPDPVAEPLFSGPLLAALDGRPDLPPWAIEALGIRSQTSRDASIVQRLIDRIPNLSEPALFAMAEILVVASTHDQPRFDRATLRRGARALRNAARRATPRGRASLREAAAIIEHPVPFGPVWGDGLDNQDAVGFMIDDPRLEPLSGPNWMSLRVVVH